MKFKVIRPNTTLKIGENLYKSGDEFEAKKDDVKSLIDAKYIKEVKDGKATIK